MARKDNKDDLEMNTQTDDTTSTCAEGLELREDTYTLLCDFTDELLEHIDELETHQGNERLTKKLRAAVRSVLRAEKLLGELLGFDQSAGQSAG